MQDHGNGFGSFNVLDYNSSIGEVWVNKKVSLVLGLLVWALMGACRTVVRETGSLVGLVTVGPLVPAVGPGVEEPTPGPEVFADRKVVIFEERGKRQLAVVDLEADGSYQVELEEGVYLVDINHLGIDHAAGLPTKVEIRPGEVVQLDIDIDTGIR
jgi:hypothetical protein